MTYPIHMLRSTLSLSLIVPTGVFIVLLAYSLLIGWNAGTTLLFWFVVLPISVYLLLKALRHGNRWHPLVATTFIYLWTFFMIYKHYASDYFVLVLISFVFNGIIMFLVALSSKSKLQIN